MDSLPRVSVLIVSHRAVYTGEAEASVYAQTYPHDRLECLTFYRGESPRDDAASVADKFNALASIATGDFLIPLCYDDRLAATYVAKCVDTARQTRADVVYTFTKIFGEKVQELGLNLCLGMDPFDAEVLKMRCVPWVTALIRRELWTTIGGYDRTQDYQDWDFWLTACRLGAIGERVHEYLYEYRAHGTNGSRTMTHEPSLRKLRRKHSFFPVPAAADASLTPALCGGDTDG